MMRYCVLLLLFLVHPLAAQESLSDREQLIVDHIENHQDEALDLLRRSVEINSGTMNFEGVREVGAFFRPEFEALGFETRWSDGAEWQRAGHLIAERPGSGPHVLLIGHLDTVFEPDSPFQSFEMLDDTTAHGPGAADMKGGIVVMLHALQALEAADALDDLHVTVVLTGDEERSGRPIDRARHDLIEAARAADVALGFENGDNDPQTVVIARRGWTGWTLDVSGTPAHSSQVFKPGVGAGAIYEASRILTEFYETLRGEEYLTFNPGLILGGTEVGHDDAAARGTAFGKDNVIAERTVVSGDLRTISMDQREQAKERMQAIVAESLPGTSAELVFDDSYPPMAPTEGNRRLLVLYDEVSRDLGFGSVEAVDPNDAGAADISFAARHVEMALDGLGLLGSGGHTTDEAANLALFPVQTERAALLLLRLSETAE